MKTKFRTNDGKIVKEIYAKKGIIPTYLGLEPIDKNNPSLLRLRVYGYNKTKKELLGKE